MPLFTDGTITTLQELTGQDAGLLDVASAEGIDVTRKLEISRDELSVELGTLLSRLGSFNQPEIPGRGFDMGAVVVTRPLKLWHTFRTLELIYRDAYNNQFNDRYLGKRNQFRDLAKWALDKLTETGIGIAIGPVPRA